MNSGRNQSAFHYFRSKFWPCQSEHINVDYGACVSSYADFQLMYAFSFWGALVLPILELHSSGHISIIFLPCSCKHLTLVEKKNGKNSKILENTCLFLRSILVTSFHKNLNFSTQKRHSLEILFAYENMLYFLILIFIFWGLKFDYHREKCRCFMQMLFRSP